MRENTTLTVGLDLGDRRSQICLIDESRAVVEESKIPTTRAGVERYFRAREPMRVALEVGTHSRWVSRALEELGHEVVVANPRKLALIYKSHQKTDRADAELLARFGQLDPNVLSPIRHRGPDAQEGLTVIRSRDVLVQARVKLINSVRGAVKAHGHRLPPKATERFHSVFDEIPEALREPLSPIMACIEKLSEEIRAYDTTLAAMADEDVHVEALRQVSGVGPVTALAFLWTIEDPERFPDGRRVPAYLGLCPRLDQSGEQDRQLPISKAGDPYLRRLLVGSAHYILGPFGPDTDLREWGLAIAARGGGNAKKRAVVAVARKLAVLLYALWKSGATYEPLRQRQRQACAHAALSPA